MEIVPNKKCKKNENTFDQVLNFVEKEKNGRNNAQKR